MKEITKNNAGIPRGGTILVAPLDWGLGHTTRCIPLIKQLSGQGFRVIIAAEGHQKALLRQEFPEMTFIDLPGYRLRYGRSSRQTVLRLFSQIPKILTSINREKRWLASFLKQHKVDMTISDNRYGFWDPSIKSVFITHQLYIKTPFGAIAERLLQKLNYRFIEKFDECWVPDYVGDENLAGILSHPAKLPAIPVRYIGALSRCYKKETTGQEQHDLLIVLSGPEPQRTLLEKMLLRELKDYHKPVCFVRGLPGAETVLKAFNQIRFYNHLSSEELNDELNSCGLLIARSGYSTVMDIMQLGKPCLFIPTPGQSEQQYLATYLSAKKRCIFFNQEDFCLKKALNHPALQEFLGQSTSNTH